MSTSSSLLGPTAHVGSRPAVAAVRAPDGARSGFDVLVLDGENRQALACVRSLGRAGLRVVVAECFAQCEPKLPVLAFGSRYAAHQVVFPDFSTDPGAYRRAVLEFVHRHPTRVVIPTADGSIAALLPVRHELAAAGCTMAVASSEQLRCANSKARTLALARSLGIVTPETLELQTESDVDQVGQRFGFPAVVKPTKSWPVAGERAARLQAVEVHDAEEARRAFRTLSGSGVRVLAQPLLTGRREGVTLFVADGEVKAVFAHVEHRTTPLLGGASVVRESISPPDDLYEPAARLVLAMGLEGLAGVEFRRDSAGRPALMEVNARPAGVLETAQRCGVDFPSLLWCWATGAQLPAYAGYRSGVRARWLRGDLRWLMHHFTEGPAADQVSRARACWVFCSEFLRPSRYDCFTLHDLRPWLVELRLTGRAVIRNTCAGWRRRRTAPAAQPSQLEDIAHGNA